MPFGFESSFMSNDDLTASFQFTRFLKQPGEGEFEETDAACLHEELFQSPACQRNVLPLYFFLTRNKERTMSVRELEKRFSCGAELIRRVKGSIEEKKPLSIPGKTPVKPVREDRVLINLVDSMTRETAPCQTLTLPTSSGQAERQSTGSGTTSNFPTNRSDTDLF